MSIPISVPSQTRAEKTGRRAVYPHMLAEESLRFLGTYGLQKVKVRGRGIRDSKKAGRYDSFNARDGKVYVTVPEQEEFGKRRCHASRRRGGK